MSKRILVTYASRTGATASYAEEIAKKIEESGIQVDVLPMQAVSGLAQYDAVVAGSAIRKSKWLPEAAEFLKSHRAELNKKPFAMFTVCITVAMSGKPEYQKVVKEWIAPVRALVHPFSDGIFPGMLDFKKLPFSWDTLQLRLTVALGIFPRDDRRDFAAARTWAAGLVPILTR